MEKMTCDDIYIVASIIFSDPVLRDNTTDIMHKISKSIDVRATYGFKIYPIIHEHNSIAQLVARWTYRIG